MLTLTPNAWKFELLPTKLEIERSTRRRGQMAARCKKSTGRPYPFKSFMQGKGMQAGLLCEELVRSRFAGFEYSKGLAIYDYDLLHEGRFGRTEVKAKRCSSPPKLDYYCSVAESSLHQDCDYYAFLRILNNSTRAWFIGFMPKADFLEAAWMFKKGQEDPNAPGTGWTFSETCRNVTIETVLRHPCNRGLRLLNMAT